MASGLRCEYCGSTDTQRRGIRNGVQRLHCNSCNLNPNVSTPEVTGESLDFTPTKSEMAELVAGKVHIVTSAQNNTPIDKKVWATILTMKKERGATLHVLPTLYKNPTSRLDPQAGDEDVWWPAEVMPYLIEGQIPLHPHLRIMGHIRVAATAASPLTGLEGISHAQSCIVGHAQIAMRVIATPQKSLPKMMLTTGSVSQKNYSKTKAGVKAEFHHSAGCVVVEIQDDHVFHMRSCVADRKGTICDLNQWYSPSGVKSTGRWPALVIGDEHSLFIDPTIKEGIYGRQGLVALGRPRVLVRHDILDSYAVSHWHRKNVLTRYVKSQTGFDSLTQEMELTCRHIDETTPEDTENLIVASNHDDHVWRWLNEVEWRNDLANAQIYHEMWAAVLEASAWDPGYGAKEPESPFALWARKRITSKTRFLGRDEHELIKGILVSLHGDNGPNGARGSLLNLSKMGVRAIIAHLHTPGIEKGCYQVGVSTGTLGYAKGSPSSWLSMNCIVQPNGKRQLVAVVKGRFQI